jgi:hypothetical protein
MGYLCLRSAGLLALAPLFLAACGGDIVFGRDRIGATPAADAQTQPPTPDAGVVQNPHDTGVVQMPYDSGVEDPPDTGVIQNPPDGGVVTHPDAGGPCPTTFPTQWPFPNTSASYQTHFWNIQAGGASLGLTCSLSSACHAVGSVNTPLVPATADIAANLMKAMTDVMTNAQPGGATALISNHHRQGAPAPNSYPFPPAVQTAVDSFVTSVQACAGCVNGVCSCTAPAMCSQ